MRRVAMTAVAALCCGLFVMSTSGSVADAQGHKLIQMRWLSDAQAKKEGLRARYGIVYYFPPKGTEEEHEIFASEQMCDWSRSSPMVKVVEPKNKKKSLEHLREEFGVPDKGYIVVVTDWFGNPHKTFAARKKSDKKLNFKQIKSAITGADMQSMKTEARLDKDMGKAEKYLKQRKYPQTIKAIEWAATVHGFDKAVRAKEILELMVEVGREQLTRALENPKDDAEEQKKVLRKIAKDFKGTVAGDEASAEISKMLKAEREAKEAKRKGSKESKE